MLKECGKSRPLVLHITFPNNSQLVKNNPLWRVFSTVETFELVMKVMKHSPLCVIFFKLSLEILSVILHQ